MNASEFRVRRTRSVAPILDTHRFQSQHDLRDGLVA